MPDSPDLVTILLGIFSGLGLAAACGFRVFVPLLVLSVAARAELLSIHPDFAWIAATPALIVLAVATMLEVLAYYLPVVDNLLDTVATPAAAIAGAVVALAVFVDLDPWLHWSLGIIAGAGIATAVQLPTAAVRGGSTVVTGGIANPGVSTGESVGSGLVSAVAIFVPIAIPFVLIALVAGVVQLIRKRRRARAERDAQRPPA
jgi:hypothetical protein